MKRKAVLVLALTESFPLAYLALQAFLLTGWFVDDSEADAMTSADWTHVAETRFLFWVVLAAILAAAVHWLNRRIAPQSRVALVMAILYFIGIAGASLCGAIDFVATKPSM
ncbi:MAG: hypothetical protein JOZ54_16970 [Acidobacteria bacterium]|nr:hypothetical protein [Acidobacteriota bacterium]